MYNKLAELLVSGLRQSFADQGHNLTGKGAASINAVITKEGDDVRIKVFALSYVAITDQGVHANRIPYGGAKSGAKTSKYIQGLTEYAKIRFNANSDEALRIAFAIAAKHKREGMPTLSSRRFSKGNRTGFVKEGYDLVRNEIVKMVGDNQLEIVKMSISKIQGR